MGCLLEAKFYCDHDVTCKGFQIPDHPEQLKNVRICKSLEFEHGGGGGSVNMSLLIKL